MVTTVSTTASREDVTALIRSLPGILTGRTQDVQGIGAGFRARLAFGLLGLIGERFKKMGRGEADITGDKWAELTKEYLAYGRPVKGRNRRLPNGRRVPQAGGRAGGSGQDGKLTKAQDKHWWRVYRQQLAILAPRFELSEAKGMAAARAWVAVKAAGGKTKIDDPGFGGRQLGQYQILKDNGTLEASLLPGDLTESGADATYTPTEGQIFEESPGLVVVGTKVPYAGFHHFGKGRRKRLLWPETIPDVWWDEILGIALGGLQRISGLFGGVR